MVMQVMYLDFVNFNARQPSLQIPRILVWTGTMLRDFSDLDLVSTGVYGFRPLLEISATCYSKVRSPIPAAIHQYIFSCFIFL